MPGASRLRLSGMQSRKSKRGALRRSEAGLADLRPNHAVRRRARFGRAQSCCDVRPADVLKVRKKRNYARIDAKELPELLRKIEEYDGSECTVLGLKLMVIPSYALRN